jgi:hypothetical protein
MKTLNIFFSWDLPSLAGKKSCFFFIAVILTSFDLPFLSMTAGLFTLLYDV